MIKRQLEHYQSTLDNMLAYNTRCLLFVSGAPGVGKTFLAQQVAARHRIKPRAIIATNVHALNEQLFRHRNSPLIIMDDADQLLTQRTCVNHIKGAFGPSRRVYFPTPQNRWNERLKELCPDKWDPEEPTPEYQVRTKLVWITNVDVVAHVEEMKPDMKSVWDALLSRSGPPINIRGHDQALYEYTLHLAQQGDLFKYRKDAVNKTIRADIAPTARKEALQWFIDNRNRINEVTPRALWMLGCTAHMFLEHNATQEIRFKQYAIDHYRNGGVEVRRVSTPRE